MIEYVEVDSLDPVEFRRRFRLPGRPVVIRGCFSDTPTWTLDYLSGKLGQEIYAIRDYGAERFDEPIYRWATYCNRRNLTFDDYSRLLTDRTAQSERLYLANTNIGDTQAGLSVAPNFNDLSTRTGLTRGPGSGGVNIWLGPANHTEPLHFDLSEGTLVQLKGSKRVSLFSPRATRGLYPFPLLEESVWPFPWFAQVDIESPDLKRFPRLAKALTKRMDVVLREGEALFIPAYWWHQVAADSAEYVCSVNQFWQVAPRWRRFAHGTAPLIATYSKVRAAKARSTSSQQ